MDDADDFSPQLGGKAHPGGRLRLVPPLAIVVDALSAQISGKAHPEPVDALIASIATRQEGVIALSQLIALGLSYRQIEYRVAAGHLHPLFRGVYAVGHRKVAPQGWLIAAQLAVPNGFLSDRTSSAVWGLRVISTKEIHITVHTTGVRSRPRLIVHRTRNPPDPEDLALRNGLTISSIPRMLIELASHERRSELDRVIDQSIRKGLLHFDALERALARHHGRPGVGKLRTALHGYRKPATDRSDLERAFQELIAPLNLPPPLRNVTLEAGWEIDFYWPEQRLAVELDGGPYHLTIRDLEKDRIKDAKLLRAGILVLRITDTRLQLDPQGVLEDLIALLN
jgi:Transcriptional regulator, AbiEi antitoxin/Protein of unknown function (DUF559)